MGMKVKLLPSLFKVPSCTQQPKTASFRLTPSPTKDDIFKTIKSVYFDPAEADSVLETPDSWFTNSSESGSLSTAEYDDYYSSMSISGDSHLEEIVRGAQQSSSVNHRLFFEPSVEDSPKLGPPPDTDVRSFTPNNKQSTPFKESTAISMESEDPYEDFKRSMEEMVRSLGVGDDWQGLEELLRWYLKVNGRKNHGYIIGAFVDLLAASIIENNSNNSSSNIHQIARSSTSFSSAASCLSSASTSDHMIC